MAKNETIAYHYDDKGYYIGEMNRQRDPLTSEMEGRDVYLMPGDCTDVKPPKEKEGFKIKWNKDTNKWAYEEVQKEEEPAPYEPTEAEKLQMQLSQKKFELSQTDYKAIKFAEGLITEEEYAPIKAERERMREEIRELQRQLDELPE